MTAEDIKRMNWEQLGASGWLSGKRDQILFWWQQQDRPYTTAEGAAISHHNILTFRPRTTDLLQVGFLRLVGVRDGEGLYEAVPPDDVRALFERRAAEIAAGEQLQLKIGD
ncbi:MAG TPA: hypothetical protein PLU30_24510 [Verrucomicrobiae bacterium]|nr:hypothetical protein [Verrucomicrobiae bacterium]